MRYSAASASSLKYFIVAIEEPESHLHSYAMHGLRKILKEIASKTQLVITTHSALFVNRTSVSSNVIVDKSKAVPATSIKKIRDILGIRASENLQHAELVLVVEGEDDRLALHSLLSVDQILAKALSDGSLALDSLGGGSNLPYKLGLLRSALCSYHCFLDNDEAGLDGFNHAENEGLLEIADANFAVCQGKSESEIEDLYNPQVYEAAIKNKFGVSLQHPKFSSNKKWSVRMGETFKGNGKPWTDKLKNEVKLKVAENVAANPQQALLDANKSAFDALVIALKAKL
jgi:putative ATP-dependent endonuclease of the OLD family